MHLDWAMSCENESCLPRLMTEGTSSFRRACVCVFYIYLQTFPVEDPLYLCRSHEFHIAWHVPFRQTRHNQHACKSPNTSSGCTEGHHVDFGHAISKTCRYSLIKPSFCHYPLPFKYIIFKYIIPNPPHNDKCLHNYTIKTLFCFM